MALKKNAIQRAEELIYPANFNSVIISVKELAEYNPENNTFCKPSLALTVGHSLGVLCELEESDNLSSAERDYSLVEFAREIKTIKSFRWKALITGGTTTTMRELKWNAPLILLFTEDIKKLDSYMENVRVANNCKQLCNTCQNGAGPGVHFQQKRRRVSKNGVGHLHSKENVRTQQGHGSLSHEEFLYS